MPRYLALDPGTKRVGAAVGESGLSIASPLEVYRREAPGVDLAHYRKLAAEHRIDVLLIGLPVTSKGGEGSSARMAREWGGWLGRELGLPVVFFDERYTSTEADQRLRERGLKASERKARVDMMAAQILLEDYLAAGCPAEVSESMPLEDPADDRGA